MATLGIHKDFLMEFARLERHVQKRVHEVLGRFQQDPAAHPLTKLTNALDPRIRTIQIDPSMRGVVLTLDARDCFLLLKVLPHEDAIAWALKHRVTINSATQGIELRDAAALQQATAGIAVQSPVDARHLFAHVPDKELLRLGIDADLLPLVRSLSAEAHLDALHKILPEQQHDVLAGLAAGMDPEAVWREVVVVQRGKPVPPPIEKDTAPDHEQPSVDEPQDALSAAMARSQGTIALVSGPDELMEILSKPFDAWRVFLHPSQRWIAYRPSYGGPARVLGGPGTGKTVVALHRALHLARQLPSDAADRSILLTTFTRDLAAELLRSLELLVPDARLRAKIQVLNVDALAHQVVRQDRDGPLHIVRDRDALARWAPIAQRPDIDFSAVFLDQEWRHVVLAQDLRSAEAYLRATRSGRGTALSPLKRAQVWRAVEAFTDELRQTGQWTFLQVCAEATRLLEERGQDLPYRHVVIDEAQDLHPAQWRLLRASVKPGPDDLFITGDAHQRIYGNKASLRSLGISVTGRSHRLRINYRTTKEILTWSTDLLAGIQADDPDSGDNSLIGYRSTLRGARPDLGGATDKSGELSGLVAQVAEWTSNGISPREIGIAVRYGRFGLDIAYALEQAGHPTCLLGRSPGTGEGVRIGTMHRMKGLEFRCMAVAGVSDGVVPMPSAITAEEVDAQQHRDDLQSELSLLFVACTRAREALRVSWHRNPSSFLVALGLNLPSPETS
ncbi:UvrD-helicase domain-containing protein [Streptomyces sp. NPDC051561]|uniref:UvrD-helicase domain-containing protein n=1 Tax=Streptomyces sp. NPDC051561 TaxID=3365658 RepID=UPI0037A0FF6C